MGGRPTESLEPRAESLEPGAWSLERDQPLHIPRAGSAGVFSIFLDVVPYHAYLTYSYAGNGPSRLANLEWNVTTTCFSVPVCIGTYSTPYGVRDSLSQRHTPYVCTVCLKKC